ncbi:unnamed protein product [Lactuca virosa]|uniref:Uncharacterized protein n=1 Tax=Lactuca virosa TaxID=75947 RepID=A0AAU9N0T4_9ASTR|nr:unnamed protein product [Lactuca virosa]
MCPWNRRIIPGEIAELGHIYVSASSSLQALHRQLIRITISPLISLPVLVLELSTTSRGLKTNRCFSTFGLILIVGRGEQRWGKAQVYIPIWAKKQSIYHHRLPPYVEGRWN